MDKRLKKIHIRNFKSLKDLELELEQFNVLIGKNGSGKTSILESFKFLKHCISPSHSPAHPFTPWWGFNNIVWCGKEDLPISFSLEYVMQGVDVKYETNISGTGGQFSFIDEKFKISNGPSILRDYNIVKYVYEEKFLDNLVQTISNDAILNSHLKQIIPEGNDVRDAFSLKQFPIPSNKTILHAGNPLGVIHSNVFIGKMDVFDETDQKNHPITIASPTFTDEQRISESMFSEAIKLLTFNDNMIFLRALDLDLIRRPCPMHYKKPLSERGTNLVNILFSWHNDKGLSRLITNALEELFPNWQISFTITEDGRIMLNVDDGDLRLSPPCIPDGFYKMLVILTAIELKPHLLLIDELDTSLHSEIIDYLLSALKTADSVVIVTTHSPLVIDLVNLEDLIMLETDDRQTRAHRIDNPADMREMLCKKGITPSESWIYAKL